jgi:hypothetical protein
MDVSFCNDPEEADLAADLAESLTQEWAEAGEKAAGEAWDARFEWEEP